MSDWIETKTGVLFEFMNPTVDMINIEDIAHALSMNCRFTGQCSRFYSVAEHSVYCSLLVDRKDALAALLHDASEAYLADIARPVKPYLENYGKIEDNLMQIIANKFGFEYPLAKTIKDADVCMLSTEAKSLMPGKGDNWTMWNYMERPKDQISVIGYPPEIAKKMFLDRFHELTQSPT
jgi:5'-deoxynucleotidase YfbR-like HD superfamily hydrolase